MLMGLHFNRTKIYQCATNRQDQGPSSTFQARHISKLSALARDMPTPLEKTSHIGVDKQNAVDLLADQPGYFLWVRQLCKLKEDLIPIYLTLVRLQLEHCVQFWVPKYKQNIDTMGKNTFHL